METDDLSQASNRAGGPLLRPQAVPTAPESLTVAGGVVLMPSLMVAHLASRGLERVRNLSTLKRTVKKDPDESVNTGSSGSFCIQSLSSLPKAVHSPVPNKSA